MECPHCAATLPDDDIFCEECGVRLAEDPQPAVLEGGCRCGAGADEIDEDGFCGRCGRRVRPRPEDHIEIAISADFAAVADRGVRHERNEDRLALRMAADRFVMVVCDGVSSSTEAQTAASAAVEAIADALEHSDGDEAGMREAIGAAAERVAELARGAVHDAPSTTAVAAMVRDRAAVIGWVGDSRAYWVDENGARQLTRDHSWLNDALASGGMTMEEAAADPKTHAITRWLGGDSGENAQPDVIRFEIPGEGALLLCTDGLWNYAAAEEEMGNVARGALEGEAIAGCRKLVEFAVERGGQDNITAALLKFGPPAARQKDEEEDGERIQG
jgi:serine/threonine protein phosphatase PrpC